MIDQNSAAVVLAPYEGQITVTSVTAGAASAAITIANTGNSDRYVTISIDAGAAGGALGAYMTAKHNADPANPAPTAISGTGRTMWFDAVSLRNVRFRPADRIKVYVEGSGTVYVRQYPSSP